ncbi:hypothetical protein FB567DRAFT_116447 [Paraphoma chrysanthemicola]|uniref:Aminoglycoside phosphotransferase domain-containing protein n=1 Tax=Paraphoma chrysanthemicola TaxID=798071 RepID=A0A8K0R064_9PLEO|nr:hypothetical protein FB567DRAFT_116447 [Paraphoma chrysanthemicola]
MMLEQDKSTCIQAVRHAYPGCLVQEFKEQGQCSYTLLVSTQEQSSQTREADHNGVSDNDQLCQIRSHETRIVQIRPAQYALDVNIAQAAKKLYPTLAPAVRILDLSLPGNMHAYEMEKLPGLALSRVLAQMDMLDTELQAKQQTLIKSFAAFIAQGYHSRAEIPSRCRDTRADSPMDNESRSLSLCTGEVGSSIVSRLEKLAMELPDEWLRRKAKNILAFMTRLHDYPVVLNHGDLISSNILVDEYTWEITGVVDWAEAEYLPFGTCLYGLELLLGYITAKVPPGMTQDDSKDGVDGGDFTYYEHANSLRKIFLAQLLDAIPQLVGRQEEVHVMRNMGVLLWYGFAWDGGAIDRVVNERDDPEEVAYLRAFMSEE